MFFLVLINYSGIGVAGLLKISGGNNILDFEFGFDHEKAYGMLTALTTEGRTFYLTKILPLDFPFPFSYMLCYASWIALLIKHTKIEKWCKYLLFIPLVAMLCDWIENIGIIAMLNGYPNLPSWAVSLASTAGMIKFIFTIGSIAAICILFVVFIIITSRKHKK